MAKKRRRRRFTPKFFIIVTLFIIAVIAVVVGIKSITQAEGESPAETGLPVPSITGAESAPPEVTPSLAPTPSPTPTPTPLPNPTSVSSTTAENFGLRTNLEFMGEDISSYSAEEPITFGNPEDYSTLEGVTTFRGNNFRDDASYGSAGAVTEKKLELVWTKEIPGSISKSNPSDGAWFGCGWTGQPLIVRWPDATKNIMNIFDEKKSKEDLVEIIYATENSHIYFLDLEDGSSTRNRIKGGWTFKGSGAIDPRGYPLLYVGAGDAGPNGAAQNQIWSLIDGEKLYTYGSKDPYALRSFSGFDGATAVNSAADTVVYCAENGIIYRFNLNTEYDEAAGTIDIDPGDILKVRYTTERHREGKSSNSYWIGFEASPVFWRNFMYVADNSGHLFCFDVNTMEAVWVQDVLDDTNCTPVLDIDEETGEASLYLGTSLHWQTDRNNTGIIPFWRINALTGEVVWMADGYRCTRSNVSGGIQNTAALGKNKLSDLVFVNYAMTTETETRGLLVAYNKTDGTEAWQKHLGSYAYASPLLMYDDDGNGYLIQCDSGGRMYLFDGRTGETLDRLQLHGNFEASPAAFNDMIVIGTRAEKIYGVRLK